MAVTLKNSSGYQWGIETDEVGIKAASFVIRLEPEFKEARHGLQNLIEGWAIGDIQRTVTIEGDVSGSTGVMAIIATTAFTPGNDVEYFGSGTTGGFYLNSAEVRQERGSWKTVSVELQANVGVT